MFINLVCKFWRKLVRIGSPSCCPFAVVFTIQLLPIFIVLCIISIFLCFSILIFRFSLDIYELEVFDL